MHSENFVSSIIVHAEPFTASLKFSNTCSLQGITAKTIPDLIQNTYCSRFWIWMASSASLSAHSITSLQKTASVVSLLLQTPEGLLVGSLIAAERPDSSLIGLEPPRPVLKLLAFCCSLLRVVCLGLVLLILKNMHRQKLFVGVADVCFLHYLGKKKKRKKKSRELSVRTM